MLQQSLQINFFYYIFIYTREEKGKGQEWRNQASQKAKITPRPIHMFPLPVHQLIVLAPKVPLMYVVPCKPREIKSSASTVYKNRVPLQTEKRVM